MEDAIKRKRAGEGWKHFPRSGVAFSNLLMKRRHISYPIRLPYLYSNNAIPSSRFPLSSAPSFLALPTSCQCLFALFFSCFLSLFVLFIPPHPLTPVPPQFLSNSPPFPSLVYPAALPQPSRPAATRALTLPARCRGKVSCGGAGAPAGGLR